MSTHTETTPETTLETTPQPTAALSQTTSGSFRDVFARGATYKLMLAIDNDDNAPAALRVVDVLAQRGAIPSVLRTLELMSPVVGSPDSMIFYANAMLDPEFYDAQSRIIGTTIRKVLGGDRKWPIKTAVGEPSSTILAEALAYDADLLVMGIHHHGLFEQALGENTATRVMSHAGIPVLGVRPDTVGLPRRMMVATDFGNASVEAAHLAANLVDPDGVVVLVHATTPVPIVEEGDEGAALVQREGIDQAFLNLTAQITHGRKIRVETVIRNGDPATQILAAAEQIGPDMIAIASQRHRLLTRLMLGSVSRKIVRDGHWSTLITPPVTIPSTVTQ